MATSVTNALASTDSSMPDLTTNLLQSTVFSPGTLGREGLSASLSVVNNNTCSVQIYMKHNFMKWMVMQEPKLLKRTP